MPKHRAISVRLGVHRPPTRPTCVTFSMVDGFQATPSFLPQRLTFCDNGAIVLYSCLPIIPAYTTQDHPRLGSGLQDARQRGASCAAAQSEQRKNHLVHTPTPAARQLPALTIESKECFRSAAMLASKPASGPVRATGPTSATVRGADQGVCLGRRPGDARASRTSTRVRQARLPRDPTQR